MFLILAVALRAASVRMNSSVPMQLPISDSVLSFLLSSMCELIYIFYTSASLSSQAAY